MIIFLIGLFIGALAGFVFAALLSSGRNADEYIYKRIVRVKRGSRMAEFGQEGLGS